MNKFIYLFAFLYTLGLSSQEFQGQAYYKTQTAMDFGSWGDKMSAEQKKAMKDRMKPFLEPVYILTFDKTKSIFKLFQQAAQLRLLCKQLALKKRRTCTRRSGCQATPESSPTFSCCASPMPPMAP